VDASGSPAVADTEKTATAPVAPAAETKPASPLSSPESSDAAAEESRKKFSKKY
jgi:hypothetical protein